jgi:hypothetical protein
MDYSRCCARTVDLIRKRFSANTPILLGIRGRGRGGTPFDCFFSSSNPLHVSPCRTSRLGECVCVGINVLMMVIQGLMVSVVFPFCPHVGRGLANRRRCPCLHLTRYHYFSRWSQEVCTFNTHRKDCHVPNEMWDVAFFSSYQIFNRMKHQGGAHRHVI